MVDLHTPAGVLNRPGTLLFSLLGCERRKSFYLSEERARIPSLICAKIVEIAALSMRIADAAKVRLFARVENQRTV